MKVSTVDELERYVAFAFAGADLLLETDAAGRICFAAGAAHAFAGRESDILAGVRIADLVSAADQVLVALMLARAGAGGRVGPTVLTSADGRTRARAAAFGLGPGEPLRMILSAVGSQSFGAGDARRDRETGLLDRDGFVALADQHLTDARHGGAPAELSLFRLDGLEAGRGGEGEAAAVLARVAAVLRLASIDGDAAGLIGPCRLAALHEPGGRAGQIEADIRAAIDLDQVRLVRSTLPLQDAVMSRREASQALLFAITGFAADIGADQPLRSLDEALARRFDATVRQMGETRRTISDAAFRLVYQPIVALADRRVRHFEALARFVDSSEPSAFVPFAENVGLIADFDLAVCRMALRHLAELRGAGRESSIAINVSARSLESDAFVDALRSACSGAGRLARRLLFEITESAGIQNLERANGVVQRLRRDGHRVCLDDFGAGAAAFHYLRALTVDYVKLDGQYTRRLLTHERDASILRTIASLCANLGVGSVAEMVETEEQAAELARIGVDLGQGWLFGHPQPSADAVPPEAAPPAPPRLARRRGAREEWR